MDINNEHGTRTDMIQTDIIEEKTFDRLISEVLAENDMLAYATEENKRKFYILARILREENEKYNLTAVKDLPGIALLHIADSLTLAKLIPYGATVLDVGAGAGFPSLPIAIARPDIRITSLDATAKKVRYIELAARNLELDNISAICGRAEDICGKELRGKFDLVTARAVSALGMLCELCTPALKVGGTFAAMKGDRAKEEMSGWEKAEKKLNVSYVQTVGLDLHYKDDHNSRNIVLFRKNAPTPATYPRQYSQIKGKPLF